MLLALLIGLPIVTIWDLFKASSEPLIHEGGWRILKPSRATIWGALFLLIAPVAIAISIRSEFSKNPDFIPLQSQGGQWGIAFGFLAILLSIWLLVRMRLRKIRYNDESILVGFNQYKWSELASVGFETATTEVFIIPNGLIMSTGKMDSSKLTLRFKPDKKIIVLPDMEGRNEFITDLKKIAKNNKIRFIAFKKPKKSK